MCILHHTKLLNPSNHQLSAVFEKNFFAPNLSKAVQEVKDKCDTCISFARLPKQLDKMRPNEVPNHPGSHMNLDIIRRSNQKIIVCTDMFSTFR